MLRGFRRARRLYWYRIRARWSTRKIPGAVFRNVVVFYAIILLAVSGLSYLGNHPEITRHILSVGRVALKWVLTDGIEVFPRLVQRIPISSTLAKSMFRQTLPAASVEEVKEIRITEDVVRDILAVVTNYDLQHPASFFQGQIPSVAVSGARLALGVSPHREAGTSTSDENQTENIIPTSKDSAEESPTPVAITAVPESEAPLPIEPPIEPPAHSTDTSSRQPILNPPMRLNLGKEALVAIYHTHTGETYRTEDNVRGKSYAWDNYKPADGPVPGVVQVGVVIAEELRTRFGIPVVHSTRIHDYPVWSRAYWNSQTTVQELVAANPELRVILDIHRDAGRTVSAATGEGVSRVLLVVTSAEENSELSHPRWRENLAFAKVLHRKFEALYPGLSKGIQIRKDNRFNQHLHPRAVLLEVGGSEDTLEQALSTARLCAHVIAEVIYDELAATGGYSVPDASLRQDALTPQIR